MFKLVIFALCVAAASAGYLAAPLAYSAPLAHAPLAHAPFAYSGYSAPLAYAAPAAYVKSYPLATSYANTYKVSLKTPVVHTAAYPLAYAAHASPFSYAAPLGYGYGYHH